MTKDNYQQEKKVTKKKWVCLFWCVCEHGRGNRAVYGPEEKPSCWDIYDFKLIETFSETDVNRGVIFFVCIYICTNRFFYSFILRT